MSRTTPLSEHVHTVVEECPGTVLLETSRFDSSHKCSYLFLKPIGLTAEERIVTAEDLKAADAVFLCNSVRGIREVKSLCVEVPARARPTASA